MYGGDRQKLWTNVSVAKKNYQDVKPISKLKKKKQKLKYRLRRTSQRLSWSGKKSL